MAATTSEIIGIFASIVVLAGLAVIIVNGKETAGVIGAVGNAFTGSIRAATLQKAK